MKLTNSELVPEQVEAQVQKWIKQVIIGLNFCPFAKKEIERQTVRYKVVEECQESAALDLLLNELSLLDKQAEIETTLVIFSHGFSHFEQYLDLLAQAEALLNQGGYAGIYQLASFHPDYVFADAEAEDPANYTNRSPFPILHILREASLDKVLSRYPDPQSIPENNIQKARALGSDYLKSLIN
ncbi:DUF1415 domain-containing protein [Paraglaciecola aestuariivivens]